MKINREEALRFIKEHDRFLLLCHDNPDGDTLGSALGLLFACKKLMKHCRVACGDGVPLLYAGLPGAKDVLRSEDAEPIEGEAVIYIDIADAPLCRRSSHLMAKNSLCIDHHATNSDYAAYTYCVPTAAACGEVILDLIHGLGIELDHTMAKCLFYAISTDTGHFAFSNTTAATFAAMAELMAYDLPIADYARDLYKVRSVGKTKLIAAALSRLTMAAGGKGAIITVRHGDYALCGAKQSETEGIIDFARDIRGVEVAALIKELSDGTCKISIRSNGDVDVSAIAASFGGGGHKKAAGFNLLMPPDAAEQTLITLMEEAL
ncbi:MAG: hypothetical protein E7328_07305 [Clostridiales bacterium]|nr:hypothetical protein [Clostridiales bacterium]